MMGYVEGSIRMESRQQCRGKQVVPVVDRVSLLAGKVEEQCSESSRIEKERERNSP
jgi:hypothetical protein